MVTRAAGTTAPTLTLTVETAIPVASVIHCATVSRTVFATSTTGLGQATAIWMSTLTERWPASHRRSARGRLRPVKRLMPEE